MDATDLSHACTRLVDAWFSVGGSLAFGPAPGSAALLGAQDFHRLHLGAAADVGYAPGQHAGLYVDAICEPTKR